VLLQANEDNLLRLKFDSILDYLKSALFDAYLVRLSGFTSGVLLTNHLSVLSYRKTSPRAQRSATIGKCNQLPSTFTKRIDLSRMRCE
jgi:hypothetical protein